MIRKALISVVGVLFLLSNLVAEPVDERKAMDMALAFIDAWHRPVEKEIRSVQAKYLPEGAISYYIVNLEDNGWILVSGDDVVQPVLAFSFENHFLPEEGWNPAAGYLLSGYQEQINLAIRDKTLKQHPGWEQPGLPTGKKSAQTYIDPFINVNWGQGSGWNRFCPVDKDGPGGRAYVGCVAVSMAQAMTVYNFPVNPKGFKSYIHATYGYISVNYDNQAPYEWNLMSSSTSDDYNARLLYHCAVSVEMDFGPDGSGAYLRTAAGALKTFFSYSQTVKSVERYPDEEDWKNLLVEELSEGRPIMYSGSAGDGNAGHAWNIDGYGDGYFHMNFGWSGSQNGYYTLNAINPGSYNFSLNQSAVVGIIPPQSAPYDIHLSAQTVMEGLPENSFVAKIKVDDEDPGNTYTYTCFGPFNLILDRRDISENFYISNDTLWTKTVFEYNSAYPSRNLMNILIRVVDQHFNKYEKEFDIAVLENPSSSTGIETLPAATPDIWPNPADNYFMIASGYDGPVTVTLYDIAGKFVGTEFVPSMPFIPSTITVDVSGLSEGIYMIVIKSNNGTETGKIVVRR